MARIKGSKNLKGACRYKKRSHCWYCKVKTYRNQMRSLFPVGLGVAHICRSCDLNLYNKDHSDKSINSTYNQYKTAK